MRTLKSTALLAIAAVGLAAAAALPARAADLVGRFGADELRLSDAPCTDAATLARIPAQDQDAFHKATGRVAGQPFAGCWRNAGTVALILWEDGDQGVVLLSQLHPAPEV